MPISNSCILSLSLSTSEKGGKGDTLKTYHNEEYFFCETTADIYRVAEKKLNKPNWTLKSRAWRPHKLSHLPHITPEFYFKNTMATGFWKPWNSTWSVPDLISSFDMRKEVALLPSPAIFWTTVFLLKGWETLAQKLIQLNHSSLNPMIISLWKWD